MPLERRTLATLRNAEFGFFGVVVNTRRHTPLLYGAAYRTGWFFFVLKPKLKAGVLSFPLDFFLGLFIS